MFVYSGERRLCDCGLQTNLVSIQGDKLKTGDVVITYHRNDDGSLGYLGGLTVVVCNQYESFSDGTHKVIKTYKDNAVDDAFVMGIKGAVDGDGWAMELVKRFDDIVDGEHWKRFGFNFSMV